MYKSIEGSNGNYITNEDGDMFNLKTGKPVNGWINGKNKSGYSLVSVKSETGKKKYMPKHIVVANAFIDKKEGCPVVMHLNDNKQDNRVNNLQRGTQADNIRSAYEHGLIPTGHNKKTYQLSNDTCPIDMIARGLEAVSEATGVNAGYYYYRHKPIPRGPFENWVINHFDPNDE